MIARIGTLIFILVAVLPAIAVHSHTQRGLNSTEIAFESWGSFLIQAQKQIDHQPIILTLSLRCASKPQTMKQLLSQRVCAYRGYTEDKVNQTLTLHFTKFNDVSDGRPEAHCDQDLGYIVDIKLECEPVRKP